MPVASADEPVDVATTQPTKSVWQWLMEALWTPPAPAADSGAEAEAQAPATQPSNVLSIEEKNAGQTVVTELPTEEVAPSASEEMQHD